LPQEKEKRTKQSRRTSGRKAIWFEYIKPNIMKNRKKRILVILILLVSFFAGQTSAQQWIKEMPGYQQYKKMSPKIRKSVKQGRISAKWASDGKSFKYSFDGKRYMFDVKKRKSIEESGEAEKEESPYERYRRMYKNAPARGRQYATETSPNKKLIANYRDGNVFVVDSAGRNEIAVTTEGSVEKRFTFGTATWVYGEELSQRHAMWWSPDSKKLAFYHFDNFVFSNPLCTKFIFCKWGVKS